MSTPKPVKIIGGGLAGLTLGIGLRRRGVPVSIVEAGHYPRHRVCGELICGRGSEVLKRLGLQGLLTRAGAVEGRTALFRCSMARWPTHRLLTPALCLSRYEMDKILADEFEQLAGELRQGERWRGGESGEGHVWASGRQAQPTEDGWRWFGLKVHARNVALEADLEMHMIQDGYVGLCRLKDGKVNVCGLFRGKSGMRTGLRREASARQGAECGAKSGQEMLRGQPGTSLFERLKEAEFVAESRCSVAGISLRRRRACEQSECRIGDALTMIPPVTGNGMSIAFESAEIAIEPLVAYSHDSLNWAAAKKAIAAGCDKAFARRLRWASWLQWMMFAPIFQAHPASLVVGHEWFWRTMFTRTR